MKMSELLTSEAKWTKGASARNAADSPTGALDADASKWCLMGAFRKCYRLYSERSKLRPLIDDAIGRNWFAWNDQSKFEDIAALLTRLNI